MGKTYVTVATFLVLVLVNVLIIVFMYGMNDIGVPRFLAGLRQTALFTTNNGINRSVIFNLSSFEGENGGTENTTLVTKVKDSIWEDIQRRRREMVENTCRKYPEKARLYDTRLYRHILVDEKHKVLFCTVPKAANSNWRRVFLVLRGRFQSVDEITTSVYNYKYTDLSSYTVDERKNMLQSYRKIMFSRHPFRRLLSAYIDKFVDDPEWNFVRRYTPKVLSANNMGPNISSPFTFEEFVVYLVKALPAAFDEHWSQLTRHCAPCLIHYDVIGTYETLDEDAKEVLNQINANVTFPSFAPHKTNTANVDVTDQYFGRLDDSQIKALYKQYAMDFEMFNYTLDQY